MADTVAAQRDPTAATPVRLKVLVSAYACEPNAGSEPGVGWETVRALAPHHDLHVLTRANNRTAIEAGVAAEPELLTGVTFHYLDLPDGVRRVIKRGAAGLNLYYFLWQRAATRRVRTLHADHRFDVAHHLTFVRYWMTPGVAGIANLPVVIGPVGGADVTPPPLLATFGSAGRAEERARAVVRNAFTRAGDLRRAMTNSAVGLATTPATAAALKALGCRDVRLMSEANVRADAIADQPPVPVRPARTVCVGRLIEWKAYHLAIRAWQQAAVEGSLELYGDGPARPRLEALARELGIAERVVFHGAVPRQQVLAGLATARLLLHPSTHDSGGWAALEAMQTGVPVVCWAHAGPGQQIDDGSGLAVPLDDEAADVQLARMADAIRTVVTDDGRWNELSRGALRRAREQFTWEAHAARLDEVYRDAAVRRS